MADGAYSSITTGCRMRSTGPTLLSARTFRSPLCGYTVILTKDAGRAFIVGSAVVVVSGMFLYSRLPAASDVASFVVTPVLSFCVLCALFLAVAVNPGVVPPAADQGSAPTAPSSFADSPAAPVFVTIKSAVIECRVCETCCVVRPPRSTHCSECNWCVEDFDHHCGVIGCCVAKRTFRYFLLFLCSITALELFIGVRVVVTLVVGSDGADPTQTALGIAALVFCACGVCMTLPLTVMNAEMVCENTLQKERIRRTVFRDAAQQIVGSPFDEGCAGNCRNRLCPEWE
jgi:palmitoyltransferase ZDHHC9/14/18